MRQRLPWIDVARGVALSAVVLHHVVLLTGRSLPAHPALLQLDLALDGFRMPTLVALSGVLVAHVRDMPWADLWRRRVAPFVLFYSAWAIVLAVLNSFIFGNPSAQLQALLTMFVWPILDLWYLLALPLYMATARATRHVPTWILVAASLAIFLGVGLREVETRAALGTWAWILAHWFFFVCAQRFAAAYRHLSARATDAFAIATLAAFALVAGVAAWLGILMHVGTLLVLSVAGTAIGFVCAAAWGSARWLGWARTVGIVSIGVYALHYAIARAIWFSIEDALPSFRGSGLVTPVLLAALATAIAALLTLGLKRWAPVPLLRAWWDTGVRESGPESTKEPREPQAQAQ